MGVCASCSCSCGYSCCCGTKKKTEVPSGITTPTSANSPMSSSNGSGASQRPGVSLQYRVRENFLSFATRMQHFNQLETLKAILETEEGRQKFAEFLRSQYADENIQFYIEVERIAQSQEDKQRRALQIYDQYVKVGGLHEINISSELRNRLERNLSMDTLHEAKDAVLKLMALSCLPKFMQSELYKSMCKPVQPKLEKERAFETWLGYFISVCETLPVCVCIVDMGLPHRPVCYVNPQFEKTTGYTKEECVGRNCSFLQGTDTDPQCVQMMREAISKGQRINIEVLNYKKDGTKFVNLLSLKPIMQKQAVRYYVGVQFDLSASRNRMHIVDDLVYLRPVISLLPDTVDW